MKTRLMKNWIALATLFVCVSSTANVAAQTPGVMPVQGYLTDANGEPITGDETATFVIYDANVGGTALWQEDVDFSVDSGTFTAILGTTTALDSAVFTASADLWVEVTLNGETLSPRLRIGKVPFASVAEIAATAETLEGLGADDFAKAGDVDWSELQSVPTNLSDIASLACNPGEVVVFDSSGWACAAQTSDTLSGLNCADGQVVGRDANGWACLERDDTYAPVAMSGSFSDLINVPTGLDDGDDDTLDALACQPGEVAQWNGMNWACADRDQAYATVATTGSFNDLSDTPTGLSDGDDDTLGGLTCQPGEVAQWNGMQWACAPRDQTYATVATTGNFSDLNGIPGGLADGDDDTLGSIVCLNGEFARYNGSFWVCDEAAALSDSLVEFSNEVRAAEYSYSSPKVGWVQVYPQDFQPNSLTTGGEFQGFYWRVNQSSPIALVAGVDLPMGAVATQFECEIHDGIAGEDLDYDFSLQQRTIGTGVVETVSGTTTGTPGYVDLLSPSFSIAANTFGNRQYFMRAFMAPNSGIASEFRFHGCRVRYEVTNVTW